MTQPVTLYVDFNDLDENRNVPVYLVFDNEGVEVERDDVVRLDDDEGNTCLGYVISLDDGTAVVQPEWSTWKKRDPLSLTVSFHASQTDLNKLLLDSIRRTAEATHSTQTLV